jgi:hypothetical protein
MSAVDCNLGDLAARLRAAGELLGTIARAFEAPDVRGIAADYLAQEDVDRIEYALTDLECLIPARDTRGAP